MNRTIAITGATGFLGSALVRYFIRNGDKVVALVRTIPAEKIPGAEYMMFDLATGNMSQDKIEADVLIHTAYVAVTDSENSLQENISGSTSLIGLFPAATKKIFVSSVSAEENSPAVYGQQKAALEILFLEHGGTAIRPGLILGNGGMFAKMRDYLKKKRNIPVFNGGKQPLQTVFVDDVVRAIDNIIIRNLKGVFTFCENEPVDYKEFYAELCRQLNVTPRFINIPFWIAKLMISVANIVRVKLPVNRDNIEGLKLMKAHRSKEDAEEIGIAPGNYKENLLRAMTN